MFLKTKKFMTVGSYQTKKMVLAGMIMCFVIKTVVRQNKDRRSPVALSLPSKF